MKQKIKILAGFFMLTFFLGACTKSQLSDVQPIEGKDMLNVSYGEKEKQVLDLYLPANRTENTKVIVLVHGGFWNQGDKNDFTTYAKFFQSQGFAVANINYRLTNTPENNIHPAQVNDIDKAIEFISSKSTEWQVSPNQFGLIGASSGGHLSLLYSYAYNKKDKVKTVVSIAGPTNLTDSRNILDFQKIITAAFLGTTIEQNLEIYKQASPITHVCDTTKPTLLVHGKVDLIVPYQQVVDLKDKLDKNKVVNDLLLFDNLGHEDVVNDINQNLVLGKIILWLNTHIK